MTNVLSESFCDLADQWLVAYAYNFSSMPIPTLFIVGQCLECYCKAALLKGDPTVVVSSGRYGHDIEFMVTELKNKYSILSTVYFLPDVQARFMTAGPPPSSLSTDTSYIHYIDNQELYWTAKFLKDLKYLGTSGRTMPGQYQVLAQPRNQFWVPILRELRQFARSGAASESLTIQTFRANGNAYPDAVDFIESVVSP